MFDHIWLWPWKPYGWVKRRDPCLRFHTTFHYCVIYINHMVSKVITTYGRPYCFQGQPWAQPPPILLNTIIFGKLSYNACSLWQQFPLYRGSSYYIARASKAQRSTYTVGPTASPSSQIILGFSYRASFKYYDKGYQQMPLSFVIFLYLHVSSLHRNSPQT